MRIYIIFVISIFLLHTPAFSQQKGSGQKMEGMDMNMDMSTPMKKAVPKKLHRPAKQLKKPASNPDLKQIIRDSVMEPAPMDSSGDVEKSMKMSPDMKMSMDTSVSMSNDSSSGMHNMQMMNMRNDFSLHLPMSRNGSGTSWHPDNSPMYMYMFVPGGWNIMLHYGIFLRYAEVNLNNRGKEGHDRQFSAPNWGMIAANHKIGKRGLFLARAMVSLDAFTVGGNGYPHLFQTGESWKGQPLVNRQHPHDIFSELALGYSYAATQDIDLYGYAGIPGEPALGPPAFMHRPSALNIPEAPISHHWQDGTHITFGVATLGFRYKNMKLEGSSFTGREPGENRYNIDRPRFDSYAFRFSVNPSKSMALSASYGYVRSPEELEERVSIKRFNVSALHTINFPMNKTLSSTFVWGLNRYSAPDESSYGSHSFLFESNLQTPKYSFFTRIEVIQKSFAELHLTQYSPQGIPLLNPNQNNLINAISLGASRYISKNRYFWADLGIMGYYYGINSDLKAYYGATPVSAEVFLRIIPPRMSMSQMSMGNMKM